MPNTLRAFVASFIAFALWCVPIQGRPAGATICDGISVTLISSKTTTKLISLVNGQKIYICGAKVFYHNGTNTSASVDLEYGTQTTNPCDTGTVDITGAITIGNLSATAVLERTVIPLQQPSIYAVPASQDLCAVTGGTTVSGIDVLVFYAQHA